MRVWRQLLVLAVALSLWAVWARAEVWALLVAYALGSCLLGWVRAQRLVVSPALLLIAAIALFAGAAVLFRSRADMIEAEGLTGLRERVADRLRLEALPAIAPPLVSGDRPQAFFVHARAGARVSVRFGVRAKALTAEEIGAGLYRVDYDPRRDGAPSPADGELRARLRVDGGEVERAMSSATPLAHPRWFARSPDGKLAATVSEETDELVIVSSRGLERRLRVGDAPTDCVFVGARQVAVSHRADRSLLIIDAESGATLISFELGAEQVRLAVSPDQKRLAVARAGRSQEIAVVDLSAPAQTERVALPASPDWVAFGPDADTMIVASRTDAALRRMERGHGHGQPSPSVWRETASLSLGRAAVTLASVRGGAQLLLATTDFRPSGQGNLANHFVQDQLLLLDARDLRVLGVRMTARRSPRQSKPGDVDRGISPMGVAEANDGSLLVSFAGSDELWRLRDLAAEPVMLDTGDLELYAPHGVAELADGTLLVSSPAAGAIGTFAPGARRPVLLRLAPDDAYLRAHNRDALARRLGERAFYEGTRSGISCQSCHMHADSDEAAHNLGTHKLLPTLSVCGTARTAPYLRDGSFARVADLDHVSQTLYRGYLRRVPGRAQTLEAFVSALPRRENPRALEGERAAERRGVLVFARAGCVDCHAPPAFTALGQHLVRSLFPRRARGLPAGDVLDAPSLLSLARSAPYLSDGRARTIRAVLYDENPDNRHGDTAGLDQHERADLVAFLESL